MIPHESFGQCLARCLKEGNLSASEAARRVGFRSRNSIFRILAGETSVEVNLRFFSALYDALKDEWPKERWYALQEALSVERLGEERYRAHRAVESVLYARKEPLSDYIVQKHCEDGTIKEYTLAKVLDDAARFTRVEIVVTGCCDVGISRLLEDRCSEAGNRGTLTIRHYIDTTKSVVTQNIMGVLPLVGKPWYNARLVEPGSCPPQMQALYRLHSIHIHCWNEQEWQGGVMLIRTDETDFSCYLHSSGSQAAVAVLDRWRFDLELLKPMMQLSQTADAYIAYTDQFAQLEKDCTICSLKPDLHFACIPAQVLEQAVLEGRAQANPTLAWEIAQAVQELKRIHQERFDNIATKRKPTYFVYHLQAMEEFMRTGLLSDHFFLQRPYTVEERRMIFRHMIDLMKNQPWFNVYFLKENAPLLKNEIGFYDGKGVLLCDAYSHYTMTEKVSEAVITLPAFMESFHQYFMDELLVHHVMSRADTLRAMERLLVMNVRE